MMKKIFIAPEPSVIVSCHFLKKTLQEVFLYPSDGFFLQIDTPFLPEKEFLELFDWLKRYSKKEFLQKIQEPGKNFPSVLDLEKIEKTFSPFTQKVFSFLKEISFGNSSTYGRLASLLQNPKAARAVGTACGKNPFPLFIPCHRVLQTDKKLGGFSCGLEVKKKLLQFENISFN